MLATSWYLPLKEWLNFASSFCCAPPSNSSTLVSSKLLLCRAPSSTKPSDFKFSVIAEWVQFVRAAPLSTGGFANCFQQAVPNALERAVIKIVCSRIAVIEPPFMRLDPGGIRSRKVGLVTNSLKSHIPMNSCTATSPGSHSAPLWKAIVWTLSLQVFNVYQWLVQGLQWGWGWLLCQTSVTAVLAREMSVKKWKSCIQLTS